MKTYQNHKNQLFGSVNIPFVPWIWIFEVVEGLGAYEGFASEIFKSEFGNLHCCHGSLWPRTPLVSWRRGGGFSGGWASEGCWGMRVTVL